MIETFYVLLGTGDMHTRALLSSIGYLYHDPNSRIIGVQHQTIYLTSLSPRSPECEWGMNYTMCRHQHDIYGFGNDNHYARLWDNSRFSFDCGIGIIKIHNLPEDKQIRLAYGVMEFRTQASWDVKDTYFIGITPNIPGIKHVKGKVIDSDDWTGGSIWI